MYLIYGKLELVIPGASSKKDKRQVIQSIKQRLIKRINISVIEAEHHELLQRTQIGFAAVCNKLADTDLIKSIIMDVVDGNEHSCEVIEFSYEVEKIYGQQ